MTRDAPPAGHDELRAPAGLQGLQLLHPRMLGVPPEQVLLVVGGPENEVAQRIQQDDASDGQPGQILCSREPRGRSIARQASQIRPSGSSLSVANGPSYLIHELKRARRETEIQLVAVKSSSFIARKVRHLGMICQVAGLQAVGEGQPGKVAEGQHEAEAFVSDVHGGQDGRLHPEAVHHVDAVENCHKPKGWGCMAQSLHHSKGSQVLFMMLYCHMLLPPYGSYA